MLTEEALARHMASVRDAMFSVANTGVVAQSTPAKFLEQCMRYDAPTQTRLIFFRGHGRLMPLENMHLRGSRNRRWDYFWQLTLRREELDRTPIQWDDRWGELWTRCFFPRYHRLLVSSKAEAAVGRILDVRHYRLFVDETFRHPVFVQGEPYSLC